MSISYTTSNTQTFTLTHAKYLACKVAADLKRIQRFYNSPSDMEIADYEMELTEYLKAGYLAEVTYGFQRNGNWVEPTLRYSARDLAGLVGSDDDPGRVRTNANVTGAVFTSYLIRNDAYHQLSTADQEKFRGQLPFSRTGAPAPGVTGYISQDKSYSSGGKALDRSSVKSF
ncbi:HORMA-1 domain-containing protein [Foetidibacter luteolus]|uniref:HORMA-1 domain-containing protein n=1 Tax=Foetidibacter luteolus TaxID=2608880 RepID=UPI00129C0043|nr:hypothetical protein [Foetidibacter luteolus]